MGATTSLQVQSATHAKYYDLIRQVVSKGNDPSKQSSLYKYAGNVLNKSNILRPIRKQADVGYAIRPTLIGKKGPSHLIGTISEKTLAQIPIEPLTDEEKHKIEYAYRLLIHIINVCAIVLGSETPGSDEEIYERTLLRTLTPMYIKDSDSDIDTTQKRNVSSRRKIIEDITTNATTAITVLEDDIQKRRNYNAFLVFLDNKSVVRKLGEYVTPRYATSSDRFTGSKKSEQLSIFQEVLRHVNTLTICGDSKQRTLLNRLSRSGDYPDILAIITSDMASLLEKEKTSSSMMNTMLRWAQMRLKNIVAYGPASEGPVMRQLFMKQGNALKKATESACSVFTKQFGQISFQPKPSGVVVHTSDIKDVAKRGDPVKTPSPPNQAVKRLYIQIQKENRSMGDAAAKAFESLFTITPQPQPGTISIPVEMKPVDPKADKSQSKTYVTLRTDVVNATDPIGMLSNTAVMLTYTIAVAYDNLWTILSKENMKAVYGFK